MDTDASNIVMTEINSFGQIIPSKNLKIALLDADTVAYTACLYAESEVPVYNRESYTDEEWAEILESGTYNEEAGTYRVTDIEQARARAEEKLEKILELTGCLLAEMHFTGGRRSFRYKIQPLYKGNRKDFIAPLGLLQLKQELAEKYNGIIHYDWEADDHVVYLMKKDPEKYILCAMDKDVLNSVQGRHFNYYESGKYNIDMRWVDTDESTTRMWPYLQCILGDKSDNIQGCRGIGPKKALKYVDPSMTTQELWNGVLAAYRSCAMTEEDAKMSFQLVNMHWLEEADGVIQLKKEVTYV